MSLYFREQKNALLRPLPHLRWADVLDSLVSIPILITHSYTALKKKGPTTSPVMSLLVSPASSISWRICRKPAIPHICLFSGTTSSFGAAVSSSFISIPVNRFSGLDPSLRPSERAEALHELRVGPLIIFPCRGFCPEPRDRLDASGVEVTIPITFIFHFLRSQGSRSHQIARILFA